MVSLKFSIFTSQKRSACMNGFQIDILHEINEKLLIKIARFVEGNQHGNIFQHPDMFVLYKGLRGHQPIYCILSQSDGIKGILLSVLLSEPAGLKKRLTKRVISFGGPVIDQQNDQPELLMYKLLEGLENHLGKTPIYIQFRLFSGEEKMNQVFLNKGYFAQKRFNTLVHIDEKDKCMKRLSESKRRQVKKSLKNGARIIQPSRMEQIEEFYKILSDLYRKKVKKPLQDISFFKRFYQFSKDGKLGIILLVEYDQKIIGGMVCPLTEGRCIYEWYICGLDKAYKSEGIYPSVLATWAAIEYAADRHIPAFDFLGAGKPGVPYGVRDFKLRFGGSVEEVYRYNKILNRPKYEVAELAYNIKRWLG